MPSIYKRLKELLGRKVTIMIIPDAQKQSKNIHINIPIFYTLSTILVTFVVGVTVSTTVLSVDNQYLSTENDTLKEKQVVHLDTINNLITINSQQTQEIASLKANVEASALYFDDKLNELMEVEAYVTELVSILNEENDVNIQLPISRSMETERILDINYAKADVTVSSNSIIDEMKLINESDEITNLIDSQADDYSQLISDVQNTLEFLEAKPDFMPVDGRITSGFGMRRDPVSGYNKFHKGIDIATSRGDDIKAAGSGVVTFSGWNGDYGRVIIISHGYNYKTVYAHNNANYVEVGETVEKGQVIGEVGNSGKSTGPHTHFEIHYEGVQINPMELVEE